MEIPEGNRKLIISGLGIVCLTVLAVTALIAKVATFDQVYNPVATMVTSIVGMFITGNLIETRMRKNGTTAPPAPAAPGQ